MRARAETRGQLRIESDAFQGELLTEEYPGINNVGTLMGKNLVCDCPLPQPCHGDALVVAYLGLDRRFRGWRKLSLVIKKQIVLIKINKQRSNCFYK